MEPAEIERLAIETFDKHRDDIGLVDTDTMAFSIELVPGGVNFSGQYMRFVVRTITWRIENGVASIRDVKEQETVLIPPDVDEDRIPIYLDGLARGIKRFVKENPSEAETLMPYDFVPRGAFRDPTWETAEDVAALVGVRGPPADSIALDDLTGTAPIAVNPDLERVIEQDPSNNANQLVYADWLSERGDPRGELIACTAPDASPTARRKAASVFANNRRYFAGPLLESDELEEFISVGWERGWIKAAVLWVDYEMSEAVPGLVEKALRTIFALQSSRFIQDVAIGCFDYAGKCDFSRLYPAMSPRASMSELFIGDTNAEQQELSWTAAGDLKTINELFPNLRKLRVRAGSMSLVDALHYPKLESLVIECGGLAQENVRAIAAANLSELRELEVWFGREDYGGYADVLPDLAPILAGERLPKLERLGLRNAEFTDELCVVLADAPILPRLQRLDLSLGTMSDVGVSHLLARRDRFAHLQSLDVDQNFITDVTALDAIGTKIENSFQRTPYDGERYCAVGE